MVERKKTEKKRDPPSLSETKWRCPSRPQARACLARLRPAPCSILSFVFALPTCAGAVVGAAVLVEIKTVMRRFYKPYQKSPAVFLSFLGYLNLPKGLRVVSKTTPSCTVRGWLRC